MKYIFLIFLFLLNKFVNNTDLDCSQNIFKTLDLTFKNSGKYLSDFGNMKNCMSND